MLEPVAISIAPLRIICAALLGLLIARVELFASAIAWQPAPVAVATSSALRCTHHPMKVRTSGVHTRFLVRELGR